MQPGAYLKKRREAAGLSLGEVARQLAAIHFGHTHLDRAALLRELERVEAGEAALTLSQAEILRNVFPFDPTVYDKLRDRELADELTRRAMPTPQICRACACSFFDPCDLTETEEGGSFSAVCDWAESDLCTACAEKDATPPVSTAADTVSPIMEGAR